MNLQGGQWYSNFDTYTKHSHKLRSTRMVFLGILDFSNGEGGSSVGIGSSSIGEGGSFVGRGASSIEGR